MQELDLPKMFEGLTPDQARQFRAGIVAAVQAVYAKVTDANGGEALPVQHSGAQSAPKTGN